MPRTALSLVLAAAAATVTVDARPDYVFRIPNGANVDGVNALGHVDPSGGGARNAFGQDFEADGEQWVTSLCMMDSDGDGQTNGQELGDPCCEWNQTSNPVTLWSTGLSHPGEVSSMSNASLWANVVCSNATMSNMTAPNSTAGSMRPGASNNATTAPSVPVVSSAMTPAMLSTTVLVVAGVAAVFM
ncbi:unnamed protein product [Hyaloperonospora brassicae]|uniref:Temptin Cys/Cys disulfide domain-containing protein n=1 Tax=Hyaloperonospora brassicae TaxID=162125 RepID=A0AAV0SYH5_HYABA|nr:unnamed protein product [Hyaloperonospora brassicae]